MRLCIVKRQEFTKTVIKKTMKKLTGVLLSAAVLCGAGQVTAQQKAAPKAVKAPAPVTNTKNPESKKTKDGYTILPGGVDYKIIKHGTGKRAENGEYVYMNIKMRADTQLIQSTWANGAPAPIPCNKAVGKGDFTSVIPYLSMGDSAVARISMDTIMAANPGQKFPPTFQKGKKIYFEVCVVGIKSGDEFKKEMDAKNKEAQDGMKKQAETDDKLIQDYLKSNSIKAEKTATGLYYAIKKDGEGATVAKGQKVSVNYTGKLLSGKMFDSNVDPSKGHVQPFEFGVGAGQVIPGWDEGLQLLKKGSQATLFIPSPLGYGPRSAGPDITPNSVLVFDIEVLDIK
jgi:FKBP-type peptidyl-prolyl cis-trans isomerase